MRRESVSSDGKAYVDLDISPAKGHIVDLVFQLKSKSGDLKFFGYYTPGVAVGTYNDKWRLGSGWGSNSYPASTDVAHLRVHVQTTAYPNGAYFIDDMTTPLLNREASAAGGTYAVFGINYGSTKGFAKVAMTVYSLTITDETSGDLIVNMIPATDASGVAGLYDTARSRFFTNANTQGTLTAGAEYGLPLTVAGVPAAFGTVSPAYDAQKAPDATTTFSLSGGTTVEGFDGTVYPSADGNSFARFDHAVFTPEGGESETVTDTSFSRTVTEEGASVTWNFTDIHHLISAGAPEGSAVRIGEGTDAATASAWLETNATVKIVATPAAGMKVLMWQGDTEGIEDLSSAEILVPADRPRALSYLVTEAVEGDSYEVTISADGYTAANGYTADSALTNFPVLVRLRTDAPIGFKYAMARADGADLRFTSVDGSVVYPHEIDTWNTEGESLIWVRIPELREGTVFKLHFGFPEATAPTDASATWFGAAGGYHAGVWHMREANGTAFDSAKHDPRLPMDGRARSNNSSSHQTAGNAMTSVDGAIGTGRTSAGCYWDIPSYDRFQIGDRFTASMWIRKPNGSGGRSFSRQASWGDAGGWGINFYQGQVGFYASANLVNTPWPSTAQDEYFLTTLVVDGKNVSAYVNGTWGGSSSSGAVVDNDLALAIGDGSGGSDIIKGWSWYDELRILSTPVGADWVKASYETVASAGFLSYLPVSGSNWEIPAAPEPVPPVAPWTAGAAVTIANEEIVVESTPPTLSSLTVENGGTLTLYGWDTLVQAETITVKAGGTIRTVGFILDGGASNRVHLAGTTLTVEDGGRITADGAGYEGQAGPAWATATWGCHGERTGTSYYGGAYGGKQGYFGNGSKSQQSKQDMEPKPYGSAEWPFDPGSGGGCCARSGGGAIYLDFSGAVTVDGAITANASDTYKSAGNWYGINASYGSGGGIAIVCSTISGSGKVSADSVIYNADKATTNYSGVNGGGASGGSGGRIAVHYGSGQGVCNISFSARGGLSYTGNATVDPSRPGEPGTLWFPDDKLFSTIGSSGVTWAGVLTVPGKTDYAFPSGLSLADGSQLGFSSDVRTVTVTGDLTATGTCGLLNGLMMPANGTLSVSGNATFTGAGLVMDGGLFSVGGDLTQAMNGTTKRRYAAPLTVQANGTSLVETNATAVVKVAGTWTVGDGCTCFAKCAVARDNWGFSYPFFSVGNFNLAAGGAINANEAGYKGSGSTGTANGTGPGRGAWAVAHGGRGGCKTAVSDADLPKLGTIYGSEQRPLAPGSASTSTSWAYDGFIGGGIVRIDVENKAFVNGTISANGNAVGSNPLGSSGGSVWLSAFRLGGTGNVTALGGVGLNGVAGGGGRIALWCYKWMDETLKANCSAAGGTHSGTYAVEPEAGTVYFGQLKPGGTMIFLR